MKRNIYKKSDCANKLPNVSSRTKLLYNNAIARNRSNSWSSNNDAVGGESPNNQIRRDDTTSETSTKSESPLPYGPDNRSMQLLLQWNGIFSDSDEEIGDNPRDKDDEALLNNASHAQEHVMNCSNDTNLNPSLLSIISNEQDILLNCSEVVNNIILQDFNTDDENNTAQSPVNDCLGDVSEDCPPPIEFTTENEDPVASPFLDTSSIVSTPQANSPFVCSTNPSTPGSTKRRNCSKRKDKGNIRKRHECEWIDSKRKKLLNLGKEFQSRNGTVRCAKKMGTKCPLTCRMKCFNKISEEQRQHIFNSFWALGDRTKQWEYMAQLAIRQAKRRVYTDMESKRKYTIKYNLPSNTNGDLDILQQVEVCKKMFLSTFSVSEQMVYTAVGKKNNTTGLFEGDLRGKHGNQPKKISNDIKESVCAHIRSLKPVESHYTRKDTGKLYLDGNLSFRRLFELYNEWDGLNSYSCKAQTERQYHDIVNDNFKLSFHVPKKDQCDQCHIFKNLDNPSAQELNKYNTHINNKTLARELKSQDKLEAQTSNGKIITASFDFQKILNAPHGDIGILYYKRKLSVFDFTVYSLGQKEGTCFMWHEGQGKRGSNEVASCLLDFIDKKVEQGCNEFRFWSDNCVGQNRNRIVYIFYVYVVLKHNIKVTHSFLEKGHTQAESDSVHAVIEKSAKSKLIFTPSEWYSLVRWSKKDGKPYDVREMEHTDFYDFKLLLQGRNWTKNLQGGKVEWNRIKKIEINAEDPFKLHYKYSLGDEYSIISITSNTRAKNKSAPLSLTPLYPNLLPISKAKIDDLLSLCSTGIIPRSHSEFFKTLKAVDIEEPMSDNDSD